MRSYSDSVYTLWRWCDCTNCFVRPPEWVMLTQGSALDGSSDMAEVDNIAMLFGASSLSLATMMNDDNKQEEALLGDNNGVDDNRAKRWQRDSRSLVGEDAMVVGAGNGVVGDIVGGSMPMVSMASCSYRVKFGLVQYYLIAYCNMHKRVVCFMWWFTAQTFKSVGQYNMFNSEYLELY